VSQLRVNRENVIFSYADFSPRSNSTPIERSGSTVSVEYADGPS
jgi:hypothetical protein